MLYKEFTVGENTYKLRLNTRNIVSLEKVIGCNPLAIFGNGDEVPTITVMVTILFYSLIALNHSITLDDAYDIFDKWLEEGHASTDFIQVIVDVYKVSGIISNKDEKNA